VQQYKYERANNLNRKQLWMDDQSTEIHTSQVRFFWHDSGDYLAILFIYI